MPAPAKINSNVSGLRYARESVAGTLIGSPIWYPVEPNSMADFGATLTKVARNPIERNRRRKKGTVVDLDATAGMNEDWTHKAFQDRLQGFFFSRFREKFDIQPLAWNGTIVPLTIIDAASDEYRAASGLGGLLAGDLLFASGMGDATNDGLKRADIASTATAISVAESLVSEAAVPAAGRLVHVGYQFASSAVNISVAAAYPRLVNASGVVAATGTLTLAANPADGDTVTIGSSVFTFETGALDAPNKVDVGASASDSIDNLIHAINGTGTPGTHYATGTVPSTQVTAAAGAGDTMDVTAIYEGETGNTIATTETFTNGGSTWAAATLTSGAGKNMLDFDLQPGEYIFIGGDTAPMQFLADADNGFKRVRRTDPDYIEFDKSNAAMSAETGTSLTIQLFFGRYIRDEDGDDQVEHPIQWEQTLGADDTSQPTQLQSRYLVGSYPNTLKLNLGLAAKVTADLNYLSFDEETYTGAEGVKSGTRPDIEESEVYNTTSNLVFSHVAIVEAGNEFPAALFASLTDGSLTIDNKMTANKRLGTLGAFAVTAGSFTVTGSFEAYFQTVTAVDSIRNNADVTISQGFFKDNQGFVYDLPLVSLGDSRINVELDQPIKLPLTHDAASGALVDADIDHTLSFVFFDYLPDLAGTNP